MKDESDRLSVFIHPSSFIVRRNTMDASTYTIKDTEQKPLRTGFGPMTTAREVAAGVNLGGKIAVVTGGSSGIGTETVRVLAEAGARVIVGVRDTRKVERALAGVSNVEAWPLDLAHPDSIDRFAGRFRDSGQALHILVNNAGIMALPLTRDRRGYEMQFATNHLGHFQLTARIWAPLRRAGAARVVSLSSVGHRRAPVDLDDPNFERRAYDKWAAYGQSKSANSLFAVELDRRCRDQGVRAFAVHPGGVLTELIRHMTDDELAAYGIVREGDKLRTPATGFKTVAQGAATSVWCAVSPTLDGRGGVYCEDCDIAGAVPGDSKLLSGVRPWAIDKAVARALWDLSERLTGIG
jgi:NAD(P)-dependent dehydrogenase (short-subunit alcohol dehydrogenase family)